MIGTGFAENPDARTAAFQAARAAVGSHQEGLEWALAFIGGALDPLKALAGLSDALGQIPVVGCAAVGGIGAGRCGYRGTEVVVAGFPAAYGPPTILIEENLFDRGEFSVGLALGRRIVESSPEGTSVLLFFDSIRELGGPPELYAASQIMAGLYQGLGHRQHTLIGAGALTDLNFGGSWIIAEHRVIKHAVVAVVLPPTIETVTRILHGCRPISSFYTITRIDGAVLYELDHRPAVQILESLVPPSVLDTDRELMLNITIGQRYGNPFAEFDEASYVNRLVLGVEREVGAIRLLDSDFAVGARVQIMMRDPAEVLASVETGTRAVTRAVAERQCLLALYIDCAGRTNAISGLDQEEAERVLEVIEPIAPVVGFYSGIEIAPLLGRSRPLDWTGVLAILVAAEKRQ